MAKLEKPRAEKEVGQVTRKAKMEAKEIVKKARTEAKEIKNQARKEANQIKTRAREQAREIKKKKQRQNKDRKDRFLHTRVPEELETKIREKADQMRVPVSILIRNLLEDAFK